VLIGSEAGCATLGWLTNTSRLRAAASHGGMPSLAEVLIEVDPSLRETVLRRPQDREAYKAALAAMDPTAYLALAEAAARRADRTGELASLDVPSLAIVGALDAPFREPAREFVEQTRGRLVVIDGTGHMPMLEQPQAVADAIDEFASSLVRVG
jgi:pimeloyl-ACP methyl ester carboxylesterase